MQIFIKSFPNEAGVDEWHLIELQGELQFNSSKVGKLVGDLHYSTSGAPILIIGHHILYGKVQKMFKPFAILAKDTDDNGKAEYIVRALINRKLIFSAPPKPLVDYVHKTN